MKDELPSSERIVITGLGLVTPLGIGKEAFWEALAAGRSGVRRVTSIDVAALPSQIAGEVPGFEPLDYLPPKEARRITRASQFAVAAAGLALRDAGLEIDAELRHEYGVLIANGGSSPPETEQMVLDLEAGGYDRISPFHVAGSSPTCRRARWPSTTA